LKSVNAILNGYFSIVKQTVKANIISYKLETQVFWDLTFCNEIRGQLNLFRALSSNVSTGFAYLSFTTKTATNEGVPCITYGRIKYREERRKKNGMDNGAAP
jgi:hypothetical protein